MCVCVYVSVCESVYMQMYNSSMSTRGYRSIREAANTLMVYCGALPERCGALSKQGLFMHVHCALVQETRICCRSLALHSRQHSAQLLPNLCQTE